jgi:hypothetical protein
MATLAELIARVALALDDADHARWSADDLTFASPPRAGTHQPRLAAPDGGYRGDHCGAARVSLAALGRVLTITDVWYPWDGEENELSAPRAPWTLLDAETLRLETAEPPWATAPTTSACSTPRPTPSRGWTAATATTLDAYGEEIVALGAAGYASLQASLAAADAINANVAAPRHFLDWATLRLRQFRLELDALRESAALVGDPRVALVAPGLRGEF